MLRPLFVLVLSGCLAVYGRSQQYVPVDNGSVIGFTIKNFAVNTSGSFTGLQGRIIFAEPDPASSLFEISVSANSINTGVKARDKHLRKEEYFDVEKFPRISFVSKQVSASGKKGEYRITGTISIKGTSKEISFPFTVTRQPEGLLIEAVFKLNRRDFKVGGSSLVLSDNLNVSLSLFAKKI